MTCKHPKSSRAFDIVLKTITSIPKKKEVRERGYYFDVINFIRTICADCGKVLKEVKVIEK